MEIRQRATVEVQVNGEEAKKELQSLESYANNLKGRLAEAHKAGDTKKIKQLEKELRETNAQLKVMRTNTKNIDVAMNNIGLATPKELRNLIKDINAKLNSGHIKRGSAEWKKYQEYLKQVNAELRKVNAEIKETEGWLTRFNNGFSKWGALAASGAAAITGVSLALSQLRKNRDDKEASAANLKALTGLDDSSIQWLTKQAEILSTSMHKTGLRVTQSSKDILEAYMLVGSAKPDLLANKEALNAVTIEAMRLSKAAKMDLKEAVDAVTLSMNQYGASADEAAKYTNVMAAGSKFGSAAVQSITSAVIKAGVTASGAKVPIEELVGSIETLAEKGIKDEVAGTGLKMFFLRLQTGAKETNPAIVGLQTALKNLHKLSTNDIVKRFGAETYSVAKALIDGADKVDYYTKAVTGTNIAMEQAAINSDTNEAKMAQYKNQIKEAGNVLMEKLNPSLSMLTGWTTKIIKAAPALIDFTKEYGATIAWLSILILTYMSRLKIAAVYQATLNTITTTASIVTGAYRLASIALNDALAGDYKALARFATQMAKTNVIAKMVTASTMLYRAAVELLSFRLKGAATAMKGFWAVVKTGGFGLIVTAITAVSVAWVVLTKRMDAATKAQQKLNDIRNKAISSIQTETTEVNNLYKIATDANASYTARKKAIEELNKLSPEYLGNLKLENINTSQAKQSLDDYISSLIRKATIQTELNRLGEINSKLAKYDNNAAKYLEKEVNAWEFLWNAVTTGSAIPEWNELLEEKKLIEENLKKTQEEDFNSTKALRTIETVTQELTNTQHVLDKLKKTNTELFSEGELISYNAQLKAASAAVVKLTEEKKQLEKKGNVNSPVVNAEEEDEKKKNEKLKAALKNVEANAAKEEAAIKAKYAKGEMAYREYCKAINENDIKELDNKMALYKEESNEYNQLLTKRQDLLKKGMEQETKFTIDEIEDCAKKEEMALIDSYHNRKISRYALNEALSMLDIATLSDKQALYKKDSKEWHDYEKQIIDVENREKLRKQEEYQQLLSSIRDSYSKKNLDQLMQEEIDGIDYLYKEELLKEEEYQKLLKAIKRKYLKEKIDQVDTETPEENGSSSLLGNEFQKLKDKYALIEDEEKRGVITHKEALQQKAEADASYLQGLKSSTEVIYAALSSMVTAYSDYTNACQDLEIAKVEKKYDAEIEAAGSNTEKGKKLQEKKEKEVAKIKSKYNQKAMKIEIAQALASTAMSAINAYSSAAQVPLIGYILAPIAAGAAVAAGMMQIATIKKQHQAQEEGYYKGGFSGPGDYKKEAGPVHYGEFIANHYAVNNPELAPVFSLLDSAQKNNTVGSLTADDVSMSLGKGKAYTVSSTGSSSSAMDDKTGMILGMVSNSMSRTSEVIEGLAAILDEGIESYVTIDGERGFEKQYTHYKKLKANKSR